MAMPEVPITSAPPIAPAQQPILEWDCHVHAFGLETDYPVIAGAAYRPPDAYPEQYLEEATRAGLKHCVYVQPSIYGADNRALLDALAKGKGHHRAIVEPSVRWDRSQFESLHMAGVRGVRLNLLSQRLDKNSTMELSAFDVAHIAPHKDILRALGWHIAVHIDVTQPGLLLDLCKTFPSIPLVLDHFGRPPRGSVVPPFGAFALLFEGLESGQVYVKLSAPYQFSKEPPPYADVGALAIHLLKSYPTRLLFGSNWPHVGGDNTIPFVQGLIASVAEWAKVASTSVNRLDANARQLYV